MNVNYLINSRPSCGLSPVNGYSLLQHWRVIIPSSLRLVACGLALASQNTKFIPPPSPSSSCGVSPCSARAGHPSSLGEIRGDTGRYGGMRPSSIEPQLSPYLPISSHISSLSSMVSCISPYLPISPHISPYLPISRASAPWSARRSAAWTT